MVSLSLLDRSGDEAWWPNPFLRSSLWLRSHLPPRATRTHNRRPQYCRCVLLCWWLWFSDDAPALYPGYL